MKKLLNDVAELHRAIGAPVLDSPQIPDWDRRNLRRVLIREEIQEVFNALFADDLIEIADGIADSIYVLVGTALEYGIPLDRVWDAVQASNMSKVDPTIGKVIIRDDGKVLKPPGFRPPDIAAALYPRWWDEPN